MKKKYLYTIRYIVISALSMCVTRNSIELPLQATPCTKLCLIRYPIALG